MIAKPLATSIRILDRSLSGRVDELRGKLLIETGLNVSKGSVFEAALKFLLEQPDAVERVVDCEIVRSAHRTSRRTTH